MCGTNSWLTVGNSLISHGEFSEIVADHFGFNFDGSEGFSGVDIDDTLDHLGKDDAVSKMCFNGLGLFSNTAFLLRLQKSFKESSVSGVQLPSKSSSLSGSQHFTKITFKNTLIRQ